MLYKYEMDKGGLGLLFYAYLKNQVVCSVVSKENQTKYFFRVDGRTELIFLQQVGKILYFCTIPCIVKQSPSNILHIPCNTIAKMMNALFSLINIFINKYILYNELNIVQSYSIYVLFKCRLKCTYIIIFFSVVLSILY